MSIEKIGKVQVTNVYNVPVANALLDRGFQIMHIRKNYASDNMVFQFKGDISNELNEILIHLGFKK